MLKSVIVARGGYFICNSCCEHVINSQLNFLALREKIEDVQLLLSMGKLTVILAGLPRKGYSIRVLHQNGQNGGARIK